MAKHAGETPAALQDDPDGLIIEHAWLRQSVDWKHRRQRAATGVLVSMCAGDDSAGLRGPIFVLARLFQRCWRPKVSFLILLSCFLAVKVMGTASTGSVIMAYNCQQTAATVGAGQRVATRAAQL